MTLGSMVAVPFAFAGPVGVAVAGVAISSLTAMRFLEGARLNETGRHCILEDEADDGYRDNAGFVKLLNTTLAPICAHLKRVMNGSKTPLTSKHINPGASFRFQLEDVDTPFASSGLASDADCELPSIVLEVTRPIMLTEKVLVESRVWPGRSYLLLRVDRAVEFLGRLPEESSSKRKPIQFKNYGGCLQAFFLCTN